MSQSLLRVDEARAPQQAYELRGWWRLFDIVLPLLLLVVGWLAIRGFWQPGVSNDGDFPLSAYRVFELNSALHQGIIFPRMGPNLNFGYGAPLFEFYPPLVSYIGVLFHALGLGYLDAVKAALTLNLFIGGFGVYGYLRWLTRRPWAACCGAMIYLCAPYILTVIYERGAAAESLALALLPWLFWMMHRLLVRCTFVAVSLAATLVALTMLAHNITALFAVPTVLLYVTVLSLTTRRWRQLGTIALATGIGLALSAFYWVPALLELKYTRAEAAMLTPQAQPSFWLLDLNHLLQSSLAAIYVGTERFHYSLWFGLLGLALWGGLRFYERQWRAHMLFLLSGWFAVLLLQLTIAERFWATLPLVRFIQFPWRLFGLSSLFLALAVGLFFSAPPLRAHLRWRYWPLSIGLLLLTFWLSLHNLSVADLTLWIVTPEKQISQIGLFERGHFNTAIFTDYTPVGMEKYGVALSLPRTADEPRFAPAPEMPIPQVITEAPNTIELALNSSVPLDLRYHRIFFPGWTVRVDGVAQPTFASGAFGLVTSQIPAGEHRVRIAFEATAVRRVSNIVSLLALILVVGLLVVGLAGWRRLLLVTVLVTVALVVGTAIVRVHASNTFQPDFYPANFDDTLYLAGYHLAQVDGEQERSLQLRLYWFVRQTPTQNLKFFIHLMKPGTEDRVAQLDEEPLHGWNPTTVWEAGELITEQYEMPLDATLEPGTYTVVIGLYDRELIQNLPVSSAPDPLPGDRVALTTITVQ